MEYVIKLVPHLAPSVAQGGCSEGKIMKTYYKLV